MQSRRRRRTGPNTDIANRRPIAWFEPEAYAAMQSIVPDYRPITGSYDLWRQATEYDERSMKRRGRFVIRVVINPVDFLGWCTERAKEPDSHALLAHVYERGGFVF